MPELKVFMIMCCVLGKPQQDVLVLSCKSCFQSLWQATLFIYGIPTVQPPFYLYRKLFIFLLHNHNKKSQKDS